MCSVKMAKLTEEMVTARSRQSDLSAVKKLNCWGAELGDVSLLRRMPNVEVLALSINKIRTLDDFTGCRRLRELYVRKNEIRDLGEIRHLRRLPDLTNLWLDENPCTQHPEYRMTVLRNLPNLEKLDNVPVYPEEVQEAMRRGHHIPDSDDEGYPQQESFARFGGARSASSSPEPADRYSREQGSDSSEAGEPPHLPLQECQSPSDARYQHPAMTRSHYEPRGRSPPAALPHSLSAHCVKECGSGSECRGSSLGSPTCPEPCCERTGRPESYRECERDRESARERDRQYPSAVMAEHRGFTRRPVARNSNLLSAVLCLVKELDYPSLEVAEMAVRCRMDELANSQ